MNENIDTEKDIEKFFRDSNNFYPGILVESIVQSIGMYDTCDDWDWGRRVYEWGKPTFRVRLYTESEEVISIGILSQNAGRFDDTIEKLWQHPTNKGR